MIDRKVLSTFQLYPTASESEIHKVEQEMSVVLPIVYKTFVQQYSNGFETEEGIAIYGIDIISERNLTYEVCEYANGYVAIGNNGGGKCLLMLAEERATELIQVDAGVMDPEYASVISENFVKWINEGAINIDLLDDEEIHRY